MTRHQTLQCVHEPFGDAYYFGPERLAERYESDSQAREESGYSESTYRTIFDRIAKENSEVRTPVLHVNWSLSISRCVVFFFDSDAIDQSLFFHLHRYEMSHELPGLLRV
jgi:hypothetical protein